jgi:hypothetical protein
VGAVAGAVACGALAGAVGSAASYGITAAQSGRFSWSGLGESVAAGAVTGALAMGLGAGLGGAAGAVTDTASGLLEGGAAADAATAATDAAADGAAGDGAAADADTAQASTEDPATEDAAPGGSAAEEQAASCGGMSFTASTRVLTAGGGLVAISKLRKGDKVIATNTRTGQTSARSVAAVLVHHDTDLYDLRVRTARGSAVIGTTRTHLFWDQDTSRWVKAAALKYGTHLRTPSSGGSVTVTGGYTPRDTAGWMWDLTIPGNNDHDFYVVAGSTAVLVHNCGDDITDVGTNAAASENPDLTARVAEIHGELDPIAQGMRTTAVLRTQEGTDILASGGEDLNPAQRALAGPGDILGSLPGEHAEATALETAFKNGLPPWELAVSRPICPDCQEVIARSGGVINDDLLGAIWP